MITTLKPVLADAQKRHYAVGAFNTNNLEQSQGIIEAAQELNSPVIISISEAALDYGGQPLVALTRELALAAKIPVVIHLDHGRHLKVIQQAVEWGVSSVMIDASAYALTKNIALTREVVLWVRQKQISVEAELGTVGGTESYIIGEDILLPQPEEARQFIQETGVDALAVGLGTSHGLPVPNEHVDYRLLDEIVKLVETPLVLHGASNLPAETIRAAVRRGITKINIDTETRQAFTKAVRESLRDRKLFDPRTYLGNARLAVSEVVRAKIKLFGGKSKAGYALPRYR